MPSGADARKIPPKSHLTHHKIMSYRCTALPPAALPSRQDAGDGGRVPALPRHPNDVPGPLGGIHLQAHGQSGLVERRDAIPLMRDFSNEFVRRRREERRPRGAGSLSGEVVSIVGCDDERDVDSLDPMTLCQWANSYAKAGHKDEDLFLAISAARRHQQTKRRESSWAEWSPTRGYTGNGDRNESENTRVRGRIFQGKSRPRRMAPQPMHTCPKKGRPVRPKQMARSNECQS